MKKILAALTLSLLALTSVLLWATAGQHHAAPINMPQTASTDSHQGEAAIGGDFTLTDQNGKTVHDTDFRGRIMLVFFGFTSCPEICPIGITTLSTVMDSLENKANEVSPIFITVDPENDTPKVMRTFLANFNKLFVGLTGTLEQVRTAASAYKAYYNKSVAEKGGEQEESIDHSGYIYLMARDGKYIRHFSYNTPPEEIAAAVRDALK